jgi:16S rRNA C967 or C1407 C5-methylase (RsmB/RsmF family)
MGRGKKRSKKTANLDDNDNAGDREVKSKTTHNNKKGGDKETTDDRKPNWHGVRKENKLFKEYYCDIQNIVPEDEVEDFMAACRRPLCLSFRINQITRNSRQIRDLLESDKFSKPLSAEGVNPPSVDEDCVVLPPEPLSWYPDNLAWRVNLTKRQLKKEPAAKEIRDFMIHRDSQGQINRQEIVSMIPPLLLDVQPGQVIWDACAAPGSKTAQIIDEIHKNQDVIFPDGIVIGNDANFQRAFMLSHQVNRLPTHCFVASNHEGQLFPNLFSLDKETDDVVRLRFDRILCDVPCSGDGTMRKNPDIWIKWNPQNSIGLHKTQVHIASRAADLLKPGGLMVYSTCSMSPIEDEAVLAELLRKFKGKLELVSVEDKLIGLKRSNGMSHWKVIDPKQEYKELLSPDEIPPRSKILPSMFPPSEEEAKEMHLERSMRILPHQQDTGGFFIALLRKHTHAGEEDSNAVIKRANSSTVDVVDVESPVNEPEPEEADGDEMKMAIVNDDDEGNAKPPKKERAAGRATVKYDEQPFTHVIADPEGQQYLKSIKEFFGFSDEFKFENVFTRSEASDSRNYRLYLVSEQIAQLVHALNDPRMLTFRKKFNLVHAGIRVFERTESHLPNLACQFRITQSGIPLLLPFMTKQLLPLPENIFRDLLEKREVKLEAYPEEDYPEMYENMKNISQGSIVTYVRLKPVPIMAAAWLSTKVIMLMVRKDGTEPILSALDDDL